MYASINSFWYLLEITVEKAHRCQSDTLLFYAHIQQRLPLNVLWFLLDQNTAVQLIFLRGKFQVSPCVHEVIPQSHLAL